MFKNSTMHNIGKVGMSAETPDVKPNGRIAFSNAMYRLTWLFGRDLGYMRC